MKTIVWQVSEEWYGRNALAYVDDYVLRVREMDGRTIYTIHEDQELVYRGEAKNLEQGQKQASGQLSLSKVSRGVSRLFGKEKKVG